MYFVNFGNGITETDSLLIILSVWHDTAIKFEEVIEQFEAWLDKHKLCGNEKGGCLEKGAFVIW